MKKNRNIIIAVIIGVVVLVAGGGGTWYFLTKSGQLKTATSMLCTSFVLQMSQIHKQRGLLMEAMENLKKEKEGAEAKDPAQAAEAEAEKFLFNEKVDKKVDEFIEVMSAKYDGNKGFKAQDNEVLSSFEGLADFLQAEASQYWGDCVADMQPAIDQCSIFQDDDEKMADCMKAHGDKIRNLMGKYLKMDLNS